MLLTPPDVFSQTLLALPMYALYEIALLICGRFLPRPRLSVLHLSTRATEHAPRRRCGTLRHANLEALMDARVAREIFRNRGRRDVAT